MRDHKNYSIYKDLKQDMRDGRLMLHDKVWMDWYEDYIISYTYRREEKVNLEALTVQELMGLITRKATLS